MPYHQNLIARAKSTIGKARTWSRNTYSTIRGKSSRAADTTVSMMGGAVKKPIAYTKNKIAQAKGEAPITFRGTAGQ